MNSDCGFHLGNGFVSQALPLPQKLLCLQSAVPTLSAPLFFGIKTPFFADIKREKEGFSLQRERLKLEGEEILSTLRRIQLQLECAQSAFEDVTDESLIDSYIYEIIALQKKYEYFLRAAKKMGLTNGVQRRAI